MEATESTNAPAYVPFDTFEAFVSQLKQVAVPDHIHKTLMPKISGAMQSHLLSALKFLGLIKPNGDTREEMHKLVQAYGTPNWKQALNEVLEKAYKPIIGDLNIKTAIGKTLRDRIRETSKLDGATLDKAIRFYVKALKTAGVEVSPHIKTRKVTLTAARRPSTNGKTPANGPSESKPDHPLVEPGMIQIPIHSPGKRPGMITIHDDFEEADAEMIFTVLKAIAKRRSGKDQPE